MSHPLKLGCLTIQKHALHVQFSYMLIYLSLWEEKAIGQTQMFAASIDGRSEARRTLQKASGMQLCQVVSQPGPG